MPCYGSAKEVVECIQRFDYAPQIMVFFLLNNWWYERDRINEGEKNVRNIDPSKGLVILEVE